MKQTMEILAIFILLLSRDAGAQRARPVQVGKGIVVSIGVPRGCMDFSVNGIFFYRRRIPLSIYPELMVHNSLSVSVWPRGESLGMTVLSGYLLGRYIVPPIRRFSPSVAVGAGVHLINSAYNTDLVTKAHMLIGFDILLASDRFLSLQVRMTYPSDIIIDSGYIGLGLKL